MSFTVRQLEIFVATAQDCNFAQTAERLGITQPAVSAHIRALEQRLGYRLFRRRPGATPVLTHEGAALHGQARMLLEESRKIVRATQRPAARKATTLRVYASPHLLDYSIRPQLARFCQQHPHVTLDFVTGIPQHRVPEMVERKQLDLAVFPTGNLAALPRDVELLHPVPWGIVGSPTLAAAATTADAISQLPFVLPLEHLLVHHWIVDRLGAIGIFPQRVVVRTQYPEVMIKMAEASEGVAVLLDEQVADAMAAGRLVRIGPNLADLHRVILRRRSTENRAVSTAEQFLRAVVNEAPLRAQRFSSGGLVRGTFSPV